MTATGRRAPVAARITLAIAVTALVVAGMAWPRAATATSSPGFPSCDRAGFDVDGDWTVATLPAFPTGPDALRILEIGPGAAPPVYASNGRVILRSLDGGCRWSAVYQAPDGLPGAPAPEIVAVDVGSGGRVVAVIEERATTPEPVRSPSARHSIVTSGDGGTTWSTSATGMPVVSATGASGTCGFPSTCHLDVSPVDPDFVFYAAAAPGESTFQLYWSTDGGVSWGRPATWIGVGPQHLQADPLHRSAVWIVHSAVQLIDVMGNGVYSQNAYTDGAVGGFSVVAATEDESDLLGVGVQTRNKPAPIDRVLKANPAEAAAAWTPADTVGLDGQWFDSLARATPRRAVIATGDGLLQLEAASERFVPVAVPGDLALGSARAETGPTGCFWFQAPSVARFARYCPPEERPPSPATGITVDPFEGCDVPVLPRVADGVQFSTTAAVEVPPSGEARLQSALDLPALPTPLDVFFLVDTSGSMEPMIASMRDSIRDAAARLIKADIDLYVGLAEQNDYPARPYRRLVDLAPLDCRMIRALDGMRTSGGRETHLVALYQSVTGAGSRELGIRPGKGASFRPGAIQIVVQATDEPYDPSVPHSPSRDAVGEEFRRRGIKHVGIAVYSGLAALPTESASKADLDDTAVRTGSLAPRGGIDCEGDGVVDLAEGAPLTCPFLESHLKEVDGGAKRADAGTVVAQVVSALRGPSPVTIEVADRGGLEVELHGATRSIDLAFPSSFRASGTVRCPAELLGQTVKMTLRARAGVNIVGERVVSVTCRDTPPVPRVAHQPRPRAVLAAAVPPPVPVPAPSAATAAQANPGSQAVGAPAAGIAPDEEDQIQVATEHAFSRRRVDPQLVPLVAASTLGFGVVVQRRRRQQAAVATAAAYAAAGSPASSGPGRSSVAARRGRARW